MTPLRDPFDEIASWASEPFASNDGQEAPRSTMFDLEAFIGTHLKVRRGPLPWGGRGTKWELEVCPFNPEHIRGCAVITRSNDGAFGFKCQHHSCIDKGWRDVRAAFEGDATRSQTEAGAASAGSLVTRRLSDVNARPVKWLWEGRIARGKLTIIAGNPGLGKSQVTASMAAILTTAGRWPVDRSKCDPGDVLILSAEDDAADTLRPRLEAAGANLQRIHIAEGVIVGFRGNGTSEQRMFCLQQDLRALEAKLSQLRDVALVVIDPITAYLGGTDSHKNADVRGLLAPLSEIAARHETAIIGISHLTKATGSQALMRVTGSLAFVAAARAAYLVTADPANPARRLFLPMKNNIGPDREGLAFSIEAATVSSPAGDLKTTRVAWESEPVTVTADEALHTDAATKTTPALSEAADWLQQVLTGGPMPAEKLYTLAKKDGIARKTLQRASSTLRVRKDKASMEGGWIWSLSTKVANSAEDAQQKGLGTFEDFGHLRNADNIVEIEI